jgi:lipopolysaccharide export system protein LptA
MKSAINSILVFLACVSAIPAAAEKADRDRPVQIEADGVRFDDAKKIAVYEGNVLLSQGTFLLTAERIEVWQDEKGFSGGYATGKPVRFRQKLEGKNEFAEGYADRIEHDAEKEIMKLMGNARLKQSDDDLRGNLIVYNTRTEVYEASGAGGETGRVRAIIQPRNNAKPGTGTEKAVKP